LTGGVPHRQPARTGRTAIRWIRVAGLLAAVATIAAVLGSQWPASWSSTASPSPTTTAPVHGPRGERGGLRREHHRRPGEPPRALGEADGAVPAGTTVFDDDVPGVAKLDPALLGALREAAGAAAGDGVELVVDSGWRSPRYQEQLLRGAISKYGSEREAARWVATPTTSAHVSGDAVDIGPAAAAWLSAHGAAYGLCRIYGNEPWHYELRPDAIDHGCSPVYADATQDPRMQR